MAVYKPTYCFPFATGVDARVAISQTPEETPVKYFSCKVDTSNKNITGYKIRILTDNNQVVFEGDEISPISELLELRLEESDLNAELNSGVNGTFLRIPFFQNNRKKLNESYNAMYYTADALADRVLYYTAGMDANDPSNINNWTYTARTKRLTYNWPNDTDGDAARRNIILLDGEALQEGDLVVASTQGTALGTNIDGVYRARILRSHDALGNLISSTYLEKMTGLTSATVVKGRTQHNSYWVYNNTSKRFEHSADTRAQWVSLVYDTNYSDGRAKEQVVELFDANNNNYKWEITLYQGNYSEYPEDTNVFGYLMPPYIRYEDVDIEWLDMTVMDGTILGSTPERIQLGGYFWGEHIIPEGTDADPLILQNKYIALGETKSTIASGLRVGVKTYDAVFAHAYPVSGSLGADDINDNNYCQFFEHSTDPNDILDTDIINRTISTNVTIKFMALQDGSWHTFGTEEEWESNSYVAERHLGVSKISGARVGDYILLYGQTVPKQNGVYQYYQENGQYCIQRAPSYETWASYLGKVMYSLDDGQNYESLATPGLYTLWNPKKVDTVSGDSAIYFRKEQPIILFNNAITKTFDLYDAQHDAPSSSSSRSADIDGVIANAGDVILYRNGKYATVANIRSDNTYVIGGTVREISSGKYYKIRRGQFYGSTVVTKQSGSISITQDCSTATILKNTKTKTFITPWIEIAKTMKLKLLDNHTVGGVQWIGINGFNNKQYYIEHNTLTSAIKSFSTTDTSYPWRYEIKTYFKTSDENPFYSYESPYVILYKNDEIFSTLGMNFSRENYLVSDGAYGQESFVVVGGSPYTVGFSSPMNAIAARAVKLSAQYMQFGQSSWENYRWALYGKAPDDGPYYYSKLFQDTGWRYDKNITATFYGLANDTAQDIPYKFVLMLENDLGDVFTQEVILYVASGTRSKTLLSESDKFVVQYDCTTESNVIFIDIDESSFNLQGDATYSIYRREYDVYPQTPVIKGTYVGGSTFRGEDGTIYRSNEQTYNRKQYFLAIPGEGAVGSVSEPTMYTCKKSATGEYYFDKTDAASFVIGDWEPVVIHTPIDKKVFRDFNITNGRSYQYVVYPGTYKIDINDISNTFQTFANYDGLIWKNNIGDTSDLYGEPTIQGQIIKGSYETSNVAGQPMCTKWDYWSIAELEPETINVDIPLLRKQYRVNNKNVWLFKYSLETGSQTQNIQREEFDTLGRYPKFGFGEMNADSGSISALLGSELVPTSKYKYIERMPFSRYAPISTNEKAEMLRQWQQFVYSKNPKLLRDIKGNAWIVHITGNSVTTRDFVEPVPSTISFEWKQVDSTRGLIIYGDYGTVEERVANTQDSAPEQKGFFATSPEVCCTGNCTELDMARVLLKDYADVINLGTRSPQNVSIRIKEDFPRVFEEVNDEYGNIFIKIPTLYRKVTKYDYSQLSGGSIRDFKISTTKVDETYEPYSVFVDADNNILPYVYIGKYASGDLYAADGLMTSKPRDTGEEPALAEIDVMRSAARANGPGYQQFDWQFQKLFVDLALILNNRGVNFQNGASEITECLGVCDLNYPVWVDGVRGMADSDSSLLTWRIATTPTHYADYTDNDWYKDIDAYQRPAWNSNWLNPDGFMTAEITALGYDEDYPFFNYPAKVDGSASITAKYNTYYCDEYFAHDYDDESRLIHPAIGHPVFCEIGKKNKKMGLWLTDVAYRETKESVNARLCYRPTSGIETQSTAPGLSRSNAYTVTVSSPTYTAGTELIFLFEDLSGVNKNVTISTSASAGTYDLYTLGTHELASGVRYGVKVCALEPNRRMSDAVILPAFTSDNIDYYGYGEFVYQWGDPDPLTPTLYITQVYDSDTEGSQLIIN